MSSLYVMVQGVSSTVHIFSFELCTAHTQREVAVVCLKVCFLSYKDVISLSATIYRRFGGKGKWM
jgi:hypothetical protein